MMIRMTIQTMKTAMTMTTIDFEKIFQLTPVFKTYLRNL